MSQGTLSAESIRNIEDCLSVQEAAPALGLVVNAAQLFKDPEFVAWLNNGEPKFTWHKDGEPGEYSDVVVLVDPSLSGEGSDSDMPERAWQLVMNACHEHVKPGGSYHVMVRLVNQEQA